MRIFLTGGTGFIGSHLLIELINNGHEVCALLRPGSLVDISSGKNLNWLEKDLNDIEEEDLKQIDIVFHLAADGVGPKKSSWEKIIRTNVVGSLHLMNISKKSKVKRFISVGTCLEYGEESLKYEKIPPHASLNPINNYAISKAVSFLALNDYAIKEKIEFFYGRIFSAYGDSQYQKNLFPSLKSAALKGNDFEIINGEDIRDFIPVDKVVYYLNQAIYREDIYPGAPLIVNIGSGEGQKISDFAQHEWKKFSAKGKLILNNAKTNNFSNYNFVADTVGLEF